MLDYKTNEIPFLMAALQTITQIEGRQRGSPRCQRRSPHRQLVSHCQRGKSLVVVTFTFPVSQFSVLSDVSLGVEGMS